MSPTAVYASPHVPPPPPAHSKGTALVIGSLSTADNGKYQALISELEPTRKIERQLLDRLVDQATTLSPSYYTSIHIALSGPDYENLMPKLSSLLSQLLSALTPLGTLHLLSLNNPTLHSLLSSELTLAGFIVLSPATETGMILSQKPPVQAPAVSLKTRSAAAPLLKLNRKKTDPAKKQALWALTSAPSTPLVDAEALLTAEDKKRPVVPTCEPVNAAAPRRKKACKGCTCGLAELEEDERKNGKVVVLDGSQDGETKVVDQNERLLMAAKNAPKATSSCGSCFLGDAFRCASCPYLGLPAFKPGEKVEIDFGMDDL